MLLGLYLKLLCDHIKFSDDLSSRQKGSIVAEKLKSICLQNTENRIEVLRSPKKFTRHFVDTPFPRVLCSIRMTP